MLQWYLFNTSILLVLFILQIFDCMDIGTSFESKHVDVLRFFDKKIEELNLFLAKKVVNEIEFQIHVHQLEWKFGLLICIW